MPNKTAILLVNLGTPQSYNFMDMRRYLAEFLSDKRVIEYNKLIWYPLLYGIILNTRPQKSGANYKRIWDQAQNKSPLLIYTENQAEKLRKLYQNNPDIGIFWAMRYGKDSIPKILRQITQEGYQKILLLPLFPQYSASTTGSIFDQFFCSLTKLRNIPMLRTIKSFHLDKNYIAALGNSIEQHIKQLDFTPQAILASYHGIPESYCQKGDPYFKQCQETSAALRQYLNLPDGKLITCFQSRFGKAEWVKPYLTDIIKELPQKNITDIAICNPGFFSDCLETIDEIGRETKEDFLHFGGKNFSHIPCLNDSSDAINLLKQLCDQHLINL